MLVNVQAPTAGWRVVIGQSNGGAMRWFEGNSEVLGALADLVTT